MVSLRSLRVKGFLLGRSTIKRYVNKMKSPLENDRFV